MKVGAVIQARMGSQRFPGKVLKEINGKPLLLYLIERLGKSPVLDVIVVATSNEKRDETIVDFCSMKKIPYFVGSLNNVAKRFRDLLDIFPLDAFVRVSGDSPLLDQHLITRAVEIFFQCSYDMVTNVQERTFPKGQSVEVIKSDFYCAHYPLFADEYDREHVTPYFYRHKERFNIFNMESGKDLDSVQLSIDTPEDFLVVERMMHLMDKPHWEYDLKALLALHAQVFQKEKAINKNA